MNLRIPFQIINKGETFTNLLHEASITLIPKLDEDITRKLQTNSPLDLDARILNKLLANQIQNYTKGNYNVEIISGIQNLFSK